MCVIPGAEKHILYLDMCNLFKIYEFNITVYIYINLIEIFNHVGEF